MQFSTLNLSSPVLRALAEEGYAAPTPIQARAIPPALEGRDILGCAQTGTGKTAAFAIPVLEKLGAHARFHASPRRSGGAPTGPEETGRLEPGTPRSGVVRRTGRALVLAPTRELATQIGDSFATYGRHTGLTHTTIFGGVGQANQVRALRAGVDIIVATPGRLIDLMEQGYVDLSGISVFVLDEADRMLDMGFIQPIRRIAAATPKTGRQTMLFSATMPRAIMHLAEALLKDPVRVSVSPDKVEAPRIEQSVYMVGRALKQSLLVHLVTEHKMGRTLVFTKTKHGADKVTKRLERAGITAKAIHGNKAQNQRERALDAFRTGKSRVLVATDVAARGLDVDGITHVINFDVPVEAESYVHRIGRTARAGASGIAISFCDHEERALLKDIEKLIKTPIATAVTPENLPREERPNPQNGGAHGGGAQGGFAGDREGFSQNRNRPHGQRGGRPGNRGHRNGTSRSASSGSGESSGHRHGAGHAHGERGHGNSAGASGEHSHAHRAKGFGARRWTKRR